MSTTYSSLGTRKSATYTGKLLPRIAGTSHNVLLCATPAMLLLSILAITRR